MCAAAVAMTKTGINSDRAFKHFCFVATQHMLTSFALTEMYVYVLMVCMCSLQIE